MADWVWARTCVLAGVGLIAACGDRATPPTDASKSATPAKHEREGEPPPAEPSSDSDEVVPISVTLPRDEPGSGARSGGRSGPDGAGDSESFGPGRNLQECRESCETKVSSEDNRATCRLLCESHHAREVTAKDGALVDGFVSCFDGCEGEATCRKRCANQPGAEACSKTCLERFGSCLAPCVGAADEGRCSERCETSARGCVSGC